MVGQDVMRCLMALGLVLQGLSFGAQAAPGGAVELYRYVNDKGVVVLDRQGAAAVHRQGLPGPQRPGPGDPHRTAGADRRGAAAAQGGPGPGQFRCAVAAPVFQPRGRRPRSRTAPGGTGRAEQRGARQPAVARCNRPTCKARRPTRSVPDVRWRRRWWTSWTISSRRKSACRVRSGASRRPAKRRKEPMPPTARGSPSYSA